MTPTYIRRLITVEGTGAGHFLEIWKSDELFHNFCQIVWIVLANRDYSTFRTIMIFLDTSLHDYYIRPRPFPPPGFEHKFPVRLPPDDIIYQKLREMLAIHCDESSHTYKATIVPQLIGSDWLHIRRILDFGSGTGQIGRDLANMIDTTIPLQMTDIRVTDDVCRLDNTLYRQNTGRANMYPPRCFDLITCFMVLHHLTYDEQVATLNNFSYWTPTGGYLLIQEHDCRTQSQQSLLEILHGFYIFVKTTKSELKSIFDHKSNYFSLEELLAMTRDRWTLVQIYRPVNQMSYNYMILLRRK